MKPTVKRDRTSSIPPLRSLSLIFWSRSYRSDRGSTRSLSILPALVFNLFHHEQKEVHALVNQPRLNFATSRTTFPKSEVSGLTQSMTSESTYESSVSFRGVSVSVSLEPYPLKLRTTFGYEFYFKAFPFQPLTSCLQTPSTSHSATNNRLNGLVTVKVRSSHHEGVNGITPRLTCFYILCY